MQLGTGVAIIEALKGPVLEGLTPLFNAGNLQVLKDTPNELSARVIVPVSTQTALLVPDVNYGGDIRCRD